MAELGFAYALSGEREKAQKSLHDLRLMAERRYTPARDYALVYAGMGDRDMAFEWLEKAYGEHGGLVDLGVEPRWNSLRADPRFADLLKRLGLTVGQREN